VIFGFTSAVLLAVIAWGLWNKSRVIPTATVAAATPAEIAASPAPAVSSTPAAGPRNPLSLAPAANSQPAPQTFIANSAAEPADYTIACSIDSSGAARGARACDSRQWGQRCQREVEFHSDPTSQENRLVMANRGSENLKFYWLDRSGHRILYAVLPPGRKIGQPSHIGAHWLVATADEHCVGIFNADTGRIGIF
jgi:hypothetical protein